MRNVLKHAGRAVAGMLPAAVLARLGMPALGAAVFLVILALAVACWVISSGDRSDRVTRMIYARHADARCLPPGPAPSSPQAWPRRRAV